MDDATEPVVTAEEVSETIRESMDRAKALILSALHIAHDREPLPDEPPTPAQ